MSLTRSYVIALALFLNFALISISVNADEKSKEENKKVEPKEELSITHHSVKIAGKEIKYTATTGLMPIMLEQEKVKGNVFFIAYTLGHKPNQNKNRPVTFSFNGGPGSSSVWLHLGLLGPRKVVTDDVAKHTKPPFELEDNPFSILDQTDLVFIDPVSTGYSRPLKDEDKKDFHGFSDDLASVAQFIRMYVTRNERWLSPKYLLGESYGTLRAAGLTHHLQSRFNMELNGIILVSSVLDFKTLHFHYNNDLPYLLFLPTYAATSHYHKRLSKEMQKKPLPQVVQECRDFVENEYANALLKGSSLSNKERKKIIQKLVLFTGLSEEYIDRTNLRIQIFRYAKELLREQDKTVGRFDSRYTGTDRDSVGDSYEYDPSGAALMGPFGATINAYLREELKVKKDIPYEVISSKVRPWDYSMFENKYVEVVDRLRTSMNKNPSLRVFVANGYYDLATPFYATEYTFNHLGIPEKLRKNNVTMKYYEGGHMMYIHLPSLKQMREDLLNFYKGKK
jgi:carboxypeptidase C (cathepsin A)